MIVDDNFCPHGALMNVSLTPELEQLVHLKVQTGRYTSASEVIREALRLMEERDQMQALHKDEIRKKIAEGMASLRAGKGADGDEFLAQMDAELAELERHKSA
jgi:antitoxin ParD1/3/4